MTTHRRGPRPARGDRPPARGRRRRARCRARPCSRRAWPGSAPRASGWPRRTSRCRRCSRRPTGRPPAAATCDGLRPALRASADRSCSRRGPRAATDALLGAWAERLRREIGGRQGEALALRAPDARASGCAPRSCWRRTARSAGRRPPSPASRRRSRPCTPIPWCTTTCPAWTTTTSAAAAPPPTGGSTSHGHPRRLPAGAGGGPRAGGGGRGSSGCRPTTLGRMAAELFQAGGIEGMVGGQWLDLEAEGRTLTLAAAHRRCTAARPARSSAPRAPSARSRREADPAQRGGADRVRRGRRARLPDRRRRTRLHRHQRGARQDGRPGRSSSPSRPMWACWASTGARSEAERLAARGGGAPRPGGGALRGTGGTGGVYCDRTIVSHAAREPRAVRPDSRPATRCCSG